MPTTVVFGNQLKVIDLLSILPPDEGEIDQIYGRIGNGKTLTATLDVISDLNRGIVWYVNWKINWNGYDERLHFWPVFFGLLGLKRTFFKFYEKNLHYFDATDMSNIICDGKSTGQDFVTWLSSLNDCKVGFDEGHFQFNSYESTRVEVNKLDVIYTPRHFDKTYLIISQRPSQIHKSARANVNRFYKCEVSFKFKIPFTRYKFQRFTKTEFQDTTGDGLPDEVRIKDENGNDTKEYALAVSSRNYWGTKYRYSLFDSKYRRRGMVTSQLNYSDVYDYTYWNKVKQICVNIVNMISFIKGRKNKVKIP